jgi:hypothetical protein
LFEGVAIACLSAEVPRDYEWSALPTSQLSSEHPGMTLISHCTGVVLRKKGCWGKGVGDIRRREEI